MSRAGLALGLPTLALILLFIAAFMIGQFPVPLHDLAAVLWESSAARKAVCRRLPKPWYGRSASRASPARC